MKKVGRIQELQNIKQQNRALKNILMHVETIVKANKLLEDTFRRGWEAGQNALRMEQAKAAERAVDPLVGSDPAGHNIIVSVEAVLDNLSLTDKVQL